MRSKNGRPADRLRRLLRESEIAVANLKGSGRGAIELLHCLDEIARLMDALEATGLDLRPERTRLETVTSLLRSRARVLVREAAQAGGLAQARQAAQPPPEHWWWFLDEEVARQRRRARKRAAIVGAVVLVVLALAALLYTRFLAPNPQVVRYLELVEEGRALYLQGDHQAALLRLREARALQPDDPDAALWQGIVADALGNDEEARAAFHAAEALFPDRAHFLCARGQCYLQAGQVAQAAADAQAALELNPELAAGFLLLGGVREAQGQRQEAIAAFQQAAKLAQAAGDEFTYVLAKTRLAALLQQP